MGDIVESNDSESPNSGSFSLDGAKAEWLYYVEGADFEDKAREILGSVEPKGDGRLTRRIPRSHPQVSWLYANAINFGGEDLIPKPETAV